MAPGGDLNATFTAGGETYPYGVLSTLLYPDGSPAYAFYQGTSMAAPHVAGVIALMLADEPGLSLSEIVNRLQSTTSTSVCSSGCGAGLIDAAAALGSGSTTPPPEPPAAGSAMTYILFSECESSTSCQAAIPTYFVEFPDVPAGGVPYTVNSIAPGRYYIEAWVDLDGETVLDESPVNIDIDTDEPFAWHSPVLLHANETTSNIDLYLGYGDNPY